MRVGSLCTGYGGLDMGLELALGGVEHAWHVEYDKHPSAILAHHWPEVPNYGDVKHTDWSQVERVDWLTAGYPCQPFSHAGKRQGADDERHLWPGVADAIRVVRPRHALLENVAGHLSLGFGQVLGDLATLGYDARWVCVRAADAGAPHGRARVFIVATDTRGGSFTGPGAAGDGLRLAPERGDLALADAHDADRRSSDPLRGPLGRDAAARSGEGRDQWGTASDPDGAGLGGEPEQHPSASTRLDGAHRGHPDGRDDGPHWGSYTSAIRRWERILGRPAPRPTEPGARSGERLSPPFVEWMMGIPAGWVTDVPGLPRNAQLKALGNGVVPQQAALACRLLGVTRQEAAA